MRERTLRERVLNKAVINWETGCWEWTARRDRHGYGKVSTNGRMSLAHRIAYELLVGPIPTGLQLDHLCRVRCCINPAHLEPVTPRENSRRAPVSVSVVNSAKTHCDHGHEFTPENTYTWHDGRYCRACNRERVRQYRTANREVLNVRQRAYRARIRGGAESEASL